MKTTNFFSVLSLALIFTGVSTVYSNNLLTGNSQQVSNATTRYEVTIHLSLGVNICNTYFVQVTDETGRLVAPAQIFVPGISKYVFTESISVPARVRLVAKLVLPSNVNPFGCPIILTTEPNVILGPFKIGRTYSFDLFPIIQKGPVNGN